MCERCTEESDREYEGDSIEERRTRAIRSVIRRHPELGIEPEQVAVRFAPKAEERCVRIDERAGRTRYRIHLPSSMGMAMSRSPPLRELGLIAWAETDRTYGDVCEVLGIEPRLQYEALFLAELPPVDGAYPEAARQVDEYEHGVTESRGE